MSIDDQNVLLVTRSSSAIGNLIGQSEKFKARYCVRGDVQKRLSPKSPNLYSLVVQWDTVRLILILQYILGLQSKSIDIKNDFSQTDITSGDPVFIELPRDSKSDGGQYDVVLRLKKTYMVNPKLHDYGTKNCEMVCQSAVLL